MTYRRVLPALAVLLFGAPATGQAGEPVAIVGATVFAGESMTRFEGATVVFQGGRIVAVGPGAALPRGARIVQAAGCWLTPGLMSSDTSLGLTDMAWVPPAADHTLDSGPFGPAFDIRYALNPDAVLLPQVRADGLTRAISSPGRSPLPPFAGLGAAIRLVPGADDLLDRPQVALFVRAGAAAAAEAGGTRAAPWLLLRAALDEARTVLAGRTPAGERRLSAADVEALRLVLERSVPLAIHASRAADIREALRLKDDYGLSVIVMGGEEAWRVASRLAAEDVPVVLDPTSDALTSFDTLGARPDNAALLQRAGVRIAFAAYVGFRGDFDGGVALREASGYAVAAGLPWDEALRAITISPAQIWGLDGHYGAIRVGADADLVVWSGDPFEVTTEALAVFVRGVRVPRVTRQSLLRDRYLPGAATRGVDPADGDALGMLCTARPGPPD